jgi:hypothetical protein
MQKQAKKKELRRINHFTMFKEKYAQGRIFALKFQGLIMLFGNKLMADSQLKK